MSVATNRRTTIETFLDTFSVSQCSQSAAGMSFISTQADPRHVNAQQARVECCRMGPNRRGPCVGHVISVTSPKTGTVELTLDAPTPFEIAIVKLADDSLLLRLVR